MLVQSSRNKLGNGYVHTHLSVQIHYAPCQPSGVLFRLVSQQALGYVRNALGFLIVTVSRYWSSSPNANNNNNAWGVNFNNGNDNNNNKNNKRRVRLVRARKWKQGLGVLFGKQVHSPSYSLCSNRD